MSWYTSIMSTAKVVSNLQRSLLNSENDGDTEDDTHVCRVLRSYYTEKGKPFPGWLPPDPKAPPPVAPVYSQPASQVGARYGAAGGMQQQQGAGGGGGGGGGLSSLWDKALTAAPQQQQEVQSLRRGRGAVPPNMRNEVRNSPFRNSDPMGGAGGGGDPQARPAAGLRTNSFQNPASAATGAPGSAQDRLKQRLWGGGARTTSPSQNSPFNPPAQAGGPRGGGGGGGGGNYEDRFAPGGAYDNSPARRGADDGGGGGGGRRPGGLPSGPRAYR